MGQQEKAPQLDISTLIGEYDNTVRLLMTENIRYRALVKQLQTQHAQEIQNLSEQLITRHEAPPAPEAPAVVEQIS